MPVARSPTPLADVRRALAVFAHPDDVDHFAGGTIPQWVEAGVDVAYLVVTRGEAGGFEDGTPRQRIPGIREAEQAAAARSLGVAQVAFLTGYADGAVEVPSDLRRDIARAIRRFRPDRVVTSSPYAPCSWAARPCCSGGCDECEVYPDAASPLRYPEQLDGERLQSWSVREVWYCEGPHPNHYVDVTGTFDRKSEAVRAHASRPPADDVLEAEIREALALAAAAAGSPARQAEAFTTVRRG